MISATSILRRVPAIIELRGRLEFEAIVLATDIFDYDYSQVREITASLGRDPKPDVNTRTRLFAHAWSMVDQLYSIRQLTRDIDQSSAVAKFRDATEPAAHLRNYKDHLADRLGNIVTSKEVLPPLLGSLSYFYFDSSDLEGEPPNQRIRGGRALSLFAGSLNKPKHSSTSVNPLGQTLALPVSQFQLAAHDHVIKLDKAKKRLSQVVSRAEESIQRSMDTHLPSLIKETAKKPEELWAPASSGLAVGLDIEFDYSNAQTRPEV